MKLYSSNESYKLYQGNMLDMLEVIEKESIDSIVCDPPYGLTSISKRFGKENSAECQYGKDGSFQRLSKGFMGKEWDGSGIEYNIETWKKCYDVLKDGGYLLAFGGSRTYHRIAVAIEDAGFEIRDTIMWLYGSGFPKSMNIGLAIDKKNGVDNRTGNILKGVGTNNTNSMNCGVSKSQEYGTEFEERKAQNEWSGWGTALKPAFEPIIVARKPFKGSCVDNVLKNGVGGINIDECRIESNERRTIPINAEKIEIKENGSHLDTLHKNQQHERVGTNLGRFPANTILTYDETDFEEVCGGFPNTKSTGGKRNDEKTTSTMNVPFANHKSGEHYLDSGSASRYFYNAKASAKDRDEGLDEFEIKSHEEINNRKEGSAGATRQYGGGTNPFLSVSCPRKNTHPTVKPTELMQYLVRLVTPNGGTVLDPFNGSGSTGKAVMYENKERNKNYKYIGIELTEEYLPIAKARIEYACKKEETVENNDIRQMSIFE